MVAKDEAKELKSLDEQTREDRKKRFDSLLGSRPTFVIEANEKERFAFFNFLVQDLFWLDKKSCAVCTSLTLERPGFSGPQWVAYPGDPSSYFDDAGRVLLVLLDNQALAASTSEKTKAYIEFYNKHLSDDNLVYVNGIDANRVLFANWASSQNPKQASREFVNFKVEMRDLLKRKLRQN